MSVIIRGRYYEYRPPNQNDIRGIEMAARKYAPICSVDGCESKHHANGFCGKHNARNSSHGSPHVILINKAPVGEQRRWLEELSKDPPSECVIWPYFISESGYGASWLDGKGCLLYTSDAADE